MECALVPRIEEKRAEWGGGCMCVPKTIKVKKREERKASLVLLSFVSGVFPPFHRLEERVLALEVPL